MDFIFGLPPNAQGRSGVLMFVNRFSKMVHLIPVPNTVAAANTAVHFIDAVFRHHGLPKSIVSDRDPRFISLLIEALRVTERANRVLEDVLRSYATSFASWSSFLPLAEFALNDNAIHASTGLTPFFVNNARHPRVPALLAVGHPTAPCLSTLGGEATDGKASVITAVLSQPVPTLVTNDFTSVASENATINAVMRAQDLKILTTPRSAASPLASWTARTLINPGAASAVSTPANYAPKQAPRPVDTTVVTGFLLQRQALLSTTGIRDSAVTNLGASKLVPRFMLIGPFTVTKIIADAYTLDIPTSLRLHPTFYVGRLKKYRSSEIPSVATSPSSSTAFQRDGPPPLIDTSGAQHWIIERIVDHDTRPCRSARDEQARELPQGQTLRGNERHYRVRRLGLPPAEDMWKTFQMSLTKRGRHSRLEA
ncbi:hypothetical protein PC129_g5605 [Phytophthora cactorum]|uniref:Tf2-1-like SH3-like domain-containing protein n=1 Tax=Phytophthora cactorum TaxID=29920 RepID=A0A8T1IL40_9STRA|nr:hypothetical protein PC114_g9434 [Phytophthora cactorum]KAG3057106.1 hypothetical protein PC122_g21139 [Phytophthora cactorum]KAG3140863.1 hypothetical protein PC128_g25101 [Phytophthora cactorum]KAG3223722.1 hypothetical protein PC129_g5605 [Phytophthora cactorum]KAG4039486.1 hypothetical protein PC123_g24964 [Phytophthora cactorum]